jgi:hypothetical protein
VPALEVVTLGVAVAVHIFIDNSNIFGGAQRAAATLEPEAVWLAVRVHYANLFRLLERDRDVRTRVMAGSVPPGNDALWSYAQRAGYRTDLLRRIQRDDGRLLEQSVDEHLHLAMANAILDYRKVPQSMVLATGDGAISASGGSFEFQVRRALRQGWNVEVWSWKEQLSGRFARIVEPNGGRPEIHHLDDHYRQITFVQAGEYTVGGSSVSVSGRIVARLGR